MISPAEVAEKGEEILVSELENPEGAVPLYKFRKNVYANINYNWWGSNC